MKSLRKILISSVVLITVGILGLIATLFAGNLYTGLSNFGTGRGYAFNPEDISNMCRGFLKNQEIVKIDMPIGESKAIELAERYLAKINLNEYAGDEAEKFYGYYTIHTLTDGDVITGMLSVNGYNGQVWYHNWHGVFIDMIEKH